MIRIICPDEAIMSRNIDILVLTQKERTVYWGTSGQRITDCYKMDSMHHDTRQKANGSKAVD
jgi:hypothetical protein